MGLMISILTLELQFQMIFYYHAASMFKDKDIDAFYMSRYSPNYARYSSSLKNFLIFTDALFCCIICYCEFYLLRNLKKECLICLY